MLAYDTRKKRPSLTDAQVLQTCAVSRLAHIWRSLNYVQKSTWFSFNSHPLVNGECAYLTFVTINSMRDGASLPNLLSAPDAPTLPPPLPESLSLKSEIRSDGEARLWLSSPYFSHTVLVYAAAPLPAAQPLSTKRGAYKLLGSLPALGGLSDLSALYAAKFRGIDVGAKLAIKLVASSTCGLRGEACVLCAVTIAAPAIAAAGPVIEQKLTAASVSFAPNAGNNRRFRLPRRGVASGRVTRRAHSP